MGRKKTPLGAAFRRPWPSTRRGLKLWLFSFVIAMKGFVYTQTPPGTSSDSALRVITENLNVPLAVCGVVIIALCAFAIFCSYSHHGRDRFGFVALVGFSAMWSAAYAVSRFILDAPHAASQGALSWFVIAGLLLVVAGDPEPPIVDLERVR